jgi:hypothetical protein
MATSNPEQEPAPALLQGSGGGRFPVPDPTTLTTEALRREVASLQVLIEQRIKAVQDLQDEKLNTLAQELEGRAQSCVQAMESIRDVVDANQKGGLALTDEKFNRVAQQFELVESQRVEQKVDTKSAVDAALIAQKEAVREQTAAFALATAKSEGSFSKQLEQQADTFGTATEALRRSIDDVKERIAEVDIKVNAVTSEKRGATDYRVGLYAAIAVGLAIAAFIAGRGGP